MKDPDWLKSDELSGCQKQKSLLVDRVRARVRAANMALAAHELSKSVEEAFESGLDPKDILQCVQQTFRNLKRSTNSRDASPLPNVSPETST